MRLAGIDIARGIAVFGMFAAHISPALPGAPQWVDDLPDGRSSILFAVLAGVSLALLSGGPTALDDREIRFRRRRIALRALIVFVIGALLTGLGTPLAIILPYYGLLFLVAIPLLRLRSAALFVIAGATGILTPVISVLLTRSLVPGGEIARFDRVDPVNLLSGISLSDLLLTGYYPVLTWIPFLVAGLGIGRLDLRQVSRQTMLAVAILLGVGGYAGSGMVRQLLGVPGTESTPDRIQGAAVPAWNSLLFATPHSGTPFEIVAGIGVALAVIAGSLYVAERLPRLSRPVSAVGVMALTVYTVQAIALKALRIPLDGTTSVTVLLAFIVLASVFSMLWLHFRRRGPLEWFVHRFSLISFRRALPVAPGAGAR